MDLSPVPLVQYSYDKDSWQRCLVHPNQGGFDKSVRVRVKHNNSHILDIQIMPTGKNGELTTSEYMGC
jgi:hypothetical protein